LSDWIKGALHGALFALEEGQALAKDQEPARRGTGIESIEVVLVLLL
jgi:nitrite reductase/ring-hydroxylating ferredoxin subunit